MRYLADLHIHSCYSRATAASSHLHGLAAWAALKGIDVLGTGDFTHPQWFQQLNEYLEEAEPGFYRLKNPQEVEVDALLPPGISTPDLSRIRFVLTAEISSIYKRGGKVRKVHNVLFAPNFEAVRRVSSVLAGVGNLESDGRPILGLDSRNLLEIMLENVPDGFLVPAHIWTPWFSLFGSKSGFDTIEECFGDLTEHIFALETGLSSDPDMNRRISALDRFTLISNSDCHSPGKLGREVNMFDTGFDYYSMREAIRSPLGEGGEKRFIGTVEFFPEEGKYHCDGHRKCGICFDPLETSDYLGICPECGRPLTIGVLNRVKELADRDKPLYPNNAPEVYSLVPLAEVLSEILGVGPATQKVMNAYGQLINRFGSEFNVLLNTSIDELAAGGSKILGEAINRIRQRKVIRQAGYDGEFGVIKVFSPEERQSLAGQMSLFGVSAAKPRAPKTNVKKNNPPQVVKVRSKKVENERLGLNPEQEAAVNDPALMVAVKAGPGTGKTHTLVQRVIRTVRESGGPCTVITFTNKAADELGLRIAAELGDQERDKVFAATFHGFCLHWLRKMSPGLEVAGPDTRHRFLRLLFPDLGVRELRRREKALTAHMNLGPEENEPCPEELQPYFARLHAMGMIDIDQVVDRLVSFLGQEGEGAAELRRATGFLFVDEFQDVNPVQYDLIRLLAETSPVFVIGDPDQAIYGFRGADPRCFLRFLDEFQPARHYLRDNYRCARSIVAAAHALIEHNPRLDDEAGAVAVVEDQGRISTYLAANEHGEAVFVAGEIEALLGGTSHLAMENIRPGEEYSFAFSDIAVLYRTAKQAAPFAEELSKHGIPFQVVDTSPFYMKGPAHHLYLWSIYTGGKPDMNILLELAATCKTFSAKSLPVLEQLLATGLEPSFPAIIQALSGLEGCQADLVLGLKELKGIGDQFVREVGENELLSGLDLLVSLISLERDDEDVARFLRLAGSHGASLSRFAEHLQRYQDSVVYDQRAEAVTLMTLHAAKGLEFPVVFIGGLEEELLPLAVRNELDFGEQEAHIREERRLFFVGMTRAMRYLYLTRASERVVYGERKKRRPSRFLEEVPGDLIIQTDRSPGGKKKKKTQRGKQLSLF